VLYNRGIGTETSSANGNGEGVIGAAGGHVIVCGLGRFGLRIVELLREQGVPVVIITENSREDRKNRAFFLGARIVNGDFRFPGIRADAGIARARAFILASSDDSANLEAALDARREAPRARVIMRVDSDRVAGRLCADFEIDAALSPPVLAAPAFVEAALAPAPEEPEESVAPVAVPLESYDARRLSRRAVPTILIVALLSLFVSGVIVFRTALNLSWTDAVYFTTTILTTVGFGDFHLREEPDNVKWFGTILMFGGVTLIAALSSFLTNFFMSGAATQIRSEQIAARYREHVIVCGLGSVGYEVVGELLKQRRRVVIVDNDPTEGEARNFAGRVPVIVGDATDPVTLRRAGVHRARAVVATVSQDLINLEIGFMARNLRQEKRGLKPLRLVLRCFGPDLAERIHAQSRAYTLLSSAEIAAPVFVEQALAATPGGLVARRGAASRSTAARSAEPRSPAV
jgi:Trk K+ transport system NAD-binding subunit